MEERKKDIGLVNSFMSLLVAFVQINPLGAKLGSYGAYIDPPRRLCESDWLGARLRMGRALRSLRSTRLRESSIWCW